MHSTADDIRCNYCNSDVCSSDLLFWAVRLDRVLWLGYSGFWKDGAGKPRVDAYANRLFARPSVNDAIIQWPGHPPSENVIHLLRNAYSQPPRRPQAPRSMP